MHRKSFYGIAFTVRKTHDFNHQKDKFYFLQYFLRKITFKHLSRTDEVMAVVI
jgi:hypothetical protein